MTKFQKQFQNLILSDLKIAHRFHDSKDVSQRTLAAFHAEQAIEKTIKLKAGIQGLTLYSHDIRELISTCKDNNIDIQVPSIIVKNADKYTSWWIIWDSCKVKSIRKDSILRAYTETLAWINSGDTK